MCQERSSEHVASPAFLANLNPRFTLDLWRACERGDWTKAARIPVMVKAFFRDWQAMPGMVSASPALAKIATRAGIYSDMPLRVRTPYRSGTQDQVDSLRRLLHERYPELAHT